LTFHWIAGIEKTSISNCRKRQNCYA